MNDHDSDLNLVAAAILLGIPIDGLLERSGILQYDGGVTRDQANRAAIALAMEGRGRRMSRGFLNEFFDLATMALELEQANGWTRAETNDWILSQLNQQPEAVALSATERIAV